MMSNPLAAVVVVKPKLKMPDLKDFVDEWNTIISTVDKTDIPLECISKIVLKLSDNRRKTINIEKLKKQGLDFDAIESVFKNIITELGDGIKDIEFILDVQAVADMIQPQTDKFLNGL